MVAAGGRIGDWWRRHAVTRQHAAEHAAVCPKCPKCPIRASISHSRLICLSHEKRNLAYVCKIENCLGHLGHLGHVVQMTYVRRRLSHRYGVDRTAKRHLWEGQACQRRDWGGHVSQASRVSEVPVEEHVRMIWVAREKAHPRER